jgi:hypothetical protein
MAICPICKNPLPMWRPPLLAENMRQFWNGGWTCRYCGSELDRKGRLIKKNEKGLKEYEDKLYKEEYIKEKARLQAQKEHNKE